MHCSLKSVLVFATAALLASTAAHAAPDEEVVRAMQRKTTGLSADDIRQNYDGCDSGVTMKMRICGSYRLTQEDLRLNKAYEKASAKAKKAGQGAALLKAQRAWIAFRDAQCPVEGKLGAGGGTAESLFVLSCTTDLTKQQADRLDAMAQTN